MEAGYIYNEPAFSFSKSNFVYAILCSIVDSTKHG
jgi:hypothetical protein